jgi:hypothetical protein
MGSVASIERMSGTALAQVNTQAKALGALVAGLDPDEVPVGEAPGLWQAFVGLERLAATGRMLLARRVDESGVWEREGYRRPADYLAHHAGVSRGAAHVSLATSKRLRGLPRTQAALRGGGLSPAQAEAIADAAAVNPEAEESLVGLAGRLSLAELRERCARAKAAADPDPDATYGRVRAARRLRRYTDAEGAWNLVARGTPDAGAFFNTVLDPIIQEIFRATRGEACDSHEAMAFDALIELAHRARTATSGLHTDSTETARTGRAGRCGQAPASGRPTPAIAHPAVDVTASCGSGRSDPGARPPASISARRRRRSSRRARSPSMRSSISASLSR